MKTSLYNNSVKKRGDNQKQDIKKRSYFHMLTTIEK